MTGKTIRHRIKISAHQYEKILGDWPNLRKLGEMIRNVYSPSATISLLWIGAMVVISSVFFTLFL